VRPDGATRGKWGILDGKDESGLMSDSELQGGSPRLSIKDCIGCALLQQALSCVLTHTRLWGPANLVASTVAELDDTQLYFTGDIGIVFGPPTDYPSRFSRGRRH
jgi:hypothetical protein